MQYLIHCNDRSYCILREGEIVYDSSNPEIKIGDLVSFYWDGNYDTIYSGTVIHASGKKFRNDNYLVKKIYSMRDFLPNRRKRG